MREFDGTPDRWIRLMNDWCCGDPLWATYGGITAASLDLPPVLANRLPDWQALWESSVDWNTGWNSEDEMRKHQIVGKRLARELPGHVVEFNADGRRAYTGAWVDGWTPTRQPIYHSVFGPAHLPTDET